MNYSVQSTVGELGKWFIPIIVPGMSDKLSNTPIRILVSASIIMVLVITFSQMFKGRSTEIPYFYLSNSNWFDRLLEPFRLLTRMNEAILKGYKMFPNQFFQLAMFNQSSSVIIVDRSHLNEFFNASDEYLDVKKGIVALSDYRYIFNVDVYENYHIAVVRGQLTQNISALIPQIVDEVNATLVDELHSLLKDNQWTPVPIFKLALSLVSRSRNSEFLQAAIQHAGNAPRIGHFLSYYPRILRPVIVKFYRALHESERVVKKHLTPILEERRADMGKMNNEPADLLQWLLKAARGVEMKNDKLIARLLSLNMAAIHTSALSFTHVLYDLISHPEYIDPLRDEIDKLVAEHGWQKATLSKMTKLDSVIKESLRLNMHHGGNRSRNTLMEVGLLRKVIKPFSFSNGITIPSGHYMASPTWGIHADDALYKNALEFDGFRFSDMVEDEGESNKQYCVTTGPEYLPFGHGKHAW